MMSQPSSKKQRRTHAASPAIAKQSTYLTRMNQGKDSEYRHLKNAGTKLLKRLSNKSSYVNASMLTKKFPMAQSGTTDELRLAANEYARVARTIDLAYDSTTHFCGKVIGMGSNEGMQLMPLSICDDDADVVSNSNIPPTYLSLMKKDVRAVSAGGLHSMALSTNGIPYTWGSSSKGVLGTNASIQDGCPSPVTGFYTTYPNLSTNICEDGLIQHIAAGDVHSLFLSINGNVYQCGVYIDSDGNNFSDDDSKKIVDVDTKKENSVFDFNQKPVHVYQLPKKAIAISAGKDYNAAILEDHSLVTWGVTTFGALARIGDGKFDGETSYIETVIDKKGGPHKEVKTTGILEQHFLRPKPVMFAHRPAITPKVIAVSCGVNHLLVVARDPTSSHGNLYSSGLNCSGQLGHGDDVDRHSLTLVEGKKDTNFAYVAAGDCFSLALTHSRDVLYSFGRSDNGQLGIGLVGARAARFYSTPQVVKFPKMVEIASIHAGIFHALALTTDHELYTWGFNEEGATGHRSAEVRVSDVSDIYRPTLLTIDVKPKCYPIQCSSSAGHHSLILVRPKTMK